MPELASNRPVSHLTTLRPLLGARPGVACEVAPGKKVELHEGDPLPRFVLAEMVPTGRGEYRVVPRPLVEWMSLSQVALERLGITLSENTMRRLGRAGFIETRQVSPSRIEFNVQSWFAHCERVRDPEFWSAPCGVGPTAALRARTNFELYQEEGL